MSCFKASTLDVCPVPELMSCKFFAKTIVFDLVCLHILEAKTKSFSSEFFGFFDVQYSKLFSGLESLVVTEKKNQIGC